MTISPEPISTCRVCAAPFFAAPLLRYENMPGAAQHLPAAADLATERGVDLEVCQCAGCGLVQLSNAPVPYYREVIRAAAYSPEMREFREGQFARFVQEHGLQGKRVVEIGCGKGEYLALMGAAGAEVYGVEYGAESVACCEQAGMTVARQFVDDPQIAIPHGPFAAFFILNFLEHLPDPNATLQGIANNLEPGGVGLVEVPNFDMILRNRLFSEFIGDHLFYFTQETLQATLQRNGFDIISSTAVWYDYILSVVVRKRSPLNISHFADFQHRLQSELSAFTGRFGPKRVAIWGAGHQALAIIALAQLGGTIRYVVDSAPFKQGKYTPATHLPIVPPDQLTTDPVDAVIVMAASYSDEVVSIIRARHGEQFPLAVVRDFGLECL